MDLERFREFASTLPHCVETVQWGSNLVLWAGDKSLGGKMFALANLEPAQYVCSFSAGPEGCAELLERDGMEPAPYLARVHWVAVERWSNLSDAEWRQRLMAAHQIMFAKIPKSKRERIAASKPTTRKAVKKSAARPA